MSDGGSENKGSLLEWLSQIDAPPVVRKITAKSNDFPFSNSMAESTHSIYKTEFMKGEYSYNKEQHIKDLKRFMIYYNDERYPTDHYGLTPNEVIEGETPCKQRFKEQKEQGKINRIAANKQFNNCPIFC